MKILIAALLLAGLCLPASLAQAPQKSLAKHSNALANVTVAKDLDERLSHYKSIPMPFNTAGLSAREVKLARKLAEAGQYLDDIYWRQSDPEALKLYLSLANATDAQSKKVRHFLKINASRFDLIDENKPFIGTEPMPPGRGFYPAGLTKKEIEEYVQLHPEKRAEIYSPTTVVERRGSELIGVPYHVAYKPFLQKAVKALREAAALTPDKDFANFLRLRADALLSDDYFASDLAWLNLKNPKFDIIFAPYETYTDGLLGVKGSYGAALMVRNEAESQKLAVFQKYVPDIQEALPPGKDDLPSKHGQPTPMEVMDVPFHSGDLNHGYMAVADNLPNDARIKEQKGTKKLFFNNFMDARVNVVILPIARRIMRADQAAKASGEGYASDVMMHEICHGLGPAFSRVNGKKVSIPEAMGPIMGATEEAKADVVGMFALQWLMDHGAMPKARAEEFYASFVAGIFRTVRFGTAEAHGRAEMMEFNYLSEKGAIVPKDGRYEVDFEKIPGAFASLAKELLEIEAQGDARRAESLFQRYGTMPAELQSALNQVKDVPVDVDPKFTFPEPVQ
jgi:tetratricopeptide (TPR) repeat protein